VQQRIERIDVGVHAVVDRYAALREVLTEFRNHIRGHLHAERREGVVEMEQPVAAATLDQGNEVR
jgi:hypothetical protein